MKNLIAIVTLIPILLFGQDVMYLKDDTKIEAHVKEITKNEVKYTHFNTNSPIRTLSQYEIAVIVYENGEHETFNSNQSTSFKSNMNILNRQFGLIAGYTSTGIWGKDSDDFIDVLEDNGDMGAHRGYRVGFFVKTTYEKKFANTWELVWTRRGFRQNYDDNDQYLVGYENVSGNGWYGTNPIYQDYDDGDYIQINYQFVELSSITEAKFFENDKISASFDVGTYLSVLAYIHTATKIDGDRDTDTSARDDSEMSFVDYGLVFGGTLNYESLSITPRYRFGLGRIDEDRDLKMNWSVLEVSMRIHF